MIKQPENEPQRAPFLRLATVLEITTVVVSILIAVWVVVPMAPANRLLLTVPTVLALFLIVYSQRIRGEGLADLGLTTVHFGHALKLVILPTLLAGLALLMIGWKSSSLRLDNTFPLKLVTLPLWGLLQQYILQAFIYRRVRSLLDQRPLAILITAGLFAFVHLPNPTLTLLTFTGALVWTSIYERAPNLYALGISHGLLSLIAMTSVPPWMLPSLSVGYKYFFYQSR